ncbi:hypothetical protein AWENTII_000307 [Aspergillus wentii]
MSRRAPRASTNPMPASSKYHRISHTKSRRGCFACKSRRVKCDEEQPICGACSVRGDECNYPPAHETRRGPVRRDATSDHGRNPGLIPPEVHAIPIRPLDFHVPRTISTPDPDPNGEARESWTMHDMNLLQHYILRTSKKMSFSPGKILVWECIIPDIAAKDTFLMHLLLALAGLDILTSNDSRRRNISHTTELHALVEHHQKGLQGLQEKLATGGDANAEAAFAGSMLIVAFAFASLGISSLCVEPQISQPLEKPQIHWMRLVRGITSIAQQFWVALKLSRLRPLLQYNNANEDWKLLGSEPPTAPLRSIQSQSLSAFALGARQAISNLRGFLSTLRATVTSGDYNTAPSPTSSTSPGSNGNPDPDQLFTAQDHAITVAEDLYMRILYVLHLHRIEPSPSHHDIQAEMEDAAISSWPHLVSDAFISSLDADHSPDIPTGFSFAILAHLYLLLTLLDGLWYLRGNFRIEIKKANALVAELDSPELAGLMAWVMDVVGLQVDTS